MDDIQRELAKGFIADQIIMGTKRSLVYNNLKDAGIYRTSASPFTRKEVKELVEEVLNEWAEEQMEERLQARRRQLREISYIKAQLHEKGDYKTLERYLRLEKDLLGTDTQEEREDTKMMLEAQARIRALELARQQEEAILQKGSIEVDYLVE